MTIAIRYMKRQNAMQQDREGWYIVDEQEEFTIVIDGPYPSYEAASVDAPCAIGG